MTDFAPDGTVLEDGEDPGKITTKEESPASPTVGSKPMTNEEKDTLLRILLNNYKLQFTKLNQKVPPIPKGLVNAALKNRWNDSRNILYWLRKNDKSRYLRTFTAENRKNEAMQKIDALFGETYKWKNRYITAYVMADPNSYNWGTYLDKVVVRSKGFKDMYPGWQDFKKQQENALLSNEDLIQKYRGLRNNFLDYYNNIMQDGSLKLSKAILTKAIVEGWGEDQFKNYIVANDANYLGSPEAREKGNQLTAFWRNVFGDRPIPEELVTQWKASTKKFGEFFNETIRETAEFKAVAPDYEEWAAAKGGFAGDEDMKYDADLDPGDYFKERQNWRQYYEVLSEKVGTVNEELISKAMRGNWSDARFKLEFQTSDPNYVGTSQAATKKEDFTLYWKQLFGIDSVPNQKLLDEYVRGNNEKVESTFDTIKQTAEFQSQYGDWDEFAQAQTGKGYASEIMQNPQVYKQYENAFYEEFQKVGVEPPETWKSDFFKTGMDDTQLGQNLQNWLATATSYKNVTGEKADIRTVAGLRGNAPGADLRIRMEKALAAHKDYASSKFGKFDVEKLSDKTLIRNI